MALRNLVFQSILLLCLFHFVLLTLIIEGITQVFNRSNLLSISEHLLYFPNYLFAFAFSLKLQKKFFKLHKYNLVRTLQSLDNLRRLLIADCEHYAFTHPSCSRCSAKHLKILIIVIWTCCDDDSGIS